MDRLGQILARMRFPMPECPVHHKPFGGDEKRGFYCPTRIGTDDDGNKLWCKEGAKYTKRLKEGGGKPAADERPAISMPATNPRLLAACAAIQAAAMLYHGSQGPVDEVMRVAGRFMYEFLEPAAKGELPKPEPEFS
jgi:hypothetical protein